jgi:hypothetical protein
VNYKDPELITTSAKLIRGLNKISDEVDKAHKVALETRNFEIELYWKRTAYFWAFVAASLTGYIAMRGSAEREVRDLSIVVAALGCFLSCAWLLVNRGSKYWQENWEKHVAMREEFATGPLFNTVLYPKEPWNPIGPYPFSVSKINSIVSIVILSVWVLLIVDYWHSELDCHNQWLFCCSLVLLGAGILCLLIFGRSSLLRHMPGNSGKDQFAFIRIGVEEILPTPDPTSSPAG